MGETPHARSRRASLAGLLLQILIAAGAFALARYVGSPALHALGWYALAGVPIWFAALLVFRQRELAALEAMDLEELRRARATTGGGEAMFGGEGGGGLGFLVARARLEWMQRWLIPAFGLISAAALAGLGAWQWVVIGGYGYAADKRPWPTLQHVDIGLVITALLMLFAFFYARYAAGLGKVREWQLLRACGSYLFGNFVVTAATIVALGAQAYRQIASWEHAVALAVPVVMLLLAAETLLNFVLDIYRPRAPGTEPRACFDSRLIGLISEPGGIAHSLAEAMNYQFGFQVSQTWFYQLLQRAFVPLVSVGVLAVWLLSGVVVVHPYERGVIEQFGRQVNADAPLTPGIHFKWPAPFALARKYNTDQLREFVVGYKAGDEPLRAPQPDQADRPEIELWTDDTHDGREHFNFVIVPGAPVAEERESPGAGRAAVHLVRMHVLVQYRIRADRLADYLRQFADVPAGGRLPHAEDALRAIAWNEVLRFNAASDVDSLIGPGDQAGEVLRQRIARRADQLKLGLEIVHVGVLDVHPEKTVAQAFRSVVKARQEKIAEIRRAKVAENEILSEVAGDRNRALTLAHAVTRIGENEVRRSELERALRSEPKVDPRQALERFAPLADAFRARHAAQWALESAQQTRDQVRDELELGAGSTPARLAQTEEEVRQRQAELAAAEESLQAALAPLRSELVRQYGEQAAARQVDNAATHYALAFWNGLLEENLRGLEGTAAVTLAEAQARRWELEMRAEAEVTRLRNERYAYRASPRIYKVRRYLQVLVDGIQGARKYVLGFNPAGRDVKIRLDAQEVARPDFTEMSLKQKE